MSSDCVWVYTDYKFDRLRKEAPEKYDSYADTDFNKWINTRVEVRGEHANLFLNGNLANYNDLFHGPKATMALALWVENGT